MLPILILRLPTTGFGSIVSAIFRDVSFIVLPPILVRRVNFYLPCAPKTDETEGRVSVPDLEIHRCR